MNWATDQLPTPNASLVGCGVHPLRFGPTGHGKSAWGNAPGFLGFRPNGPFDCLARAIGPGSIATRHQRPEGPTVRNANKRPTLRASGKQDGSQSWADGPGYANGWAFGPESLKNTQENTSQRNPVRVRVQTADQPGATIFRIRRFSCPRLICPSLSGSLQEARSSINANQCSAHLTARTSFRAKPNHHRFNWFETTHTRQS